MLFSLAFSMVFSMLHSERSTSTMLIELDDLNRQAWCNIVVLRLYLVAHYSKIQINILIFKDTELILLYSKIQIKAEEGCARARTIRKGNPPSSHWTLGSVDPTFRRAASP